MRAHSKHMSHQKKNLNIRARAQGRTCGFILSATSSLISALDILLLAGRRTIHAPTTSPYVSSGTEIAAASKTEGCVVSAFSICTGNKF